SRDSSSSSGRTSAWCPRSSDSRHCRHNRRPLHTSHSGRAWRASDARSSGRRSSGTTWSARDSCGARFISSRPGTSMPTRSRRRLSRGKRPSEQDALEILVRRCVSAFGPVTLADVAKFAGQAPPRVRPALEGTASKLLIFKDETGRILYDMPRAIRPSSAVKAPVRFLPRYDELLIAYQHRDRLIAPAHRSAIYAKNGIVEAVVLVDGFAAATWGLVRA